MSEKPKGWWRAVKTADATEECNVVQMPKPTLDDLERQLIDAQNAVISAGIECDRSAMIYKDRLDQFKAARARLSERLKTCDALVTFPTEFPEVECPPTQALKSPPSGI